MTWFSHIYFLYHNRSLIYFVSSGDETEIRCVSIIDRFVLGEIISPRIVDVVSSI